MAPHSSALAWRISWTEEPGGLLSMGSHRVGHDWSDLAAAAAALQCTGMHCLWHRLNEELQTFNYRPNPAYHLFLRTPRTKNGFWFCFVFLIFIYLFGCIGSQLWHMGSSLHYAGYFVVAHGIFVALCRIFCCGTWDLLCIMRGILLRCIGSPVLACRLSCCTTGLITPQHVGS